MDMKILDNLKSCLPKDCNSFNEWNHSSTMPMGSFYIFLAGGNVEAGVVSIESDHILVIQLKLFQIAID